MSFLDYQDELEARAAERQIERNGNRNDIMAYMDELEARRLREQVTLNEERATKREQRYSTLIPCKK